MGQDHSDLNVMLSQMSKQAERPMEQCETCCDWVKPEDVRVGELGWLRCRRCCEQIEAAIRAPVVGDFTDIWDMALLSSCSGPTTSTVVPVCPGPFHGFAPNDDKEHRPWWARESFWRDGLHAAGIWMLFWTFSPQDVVEIWRWARAEKTAHCPQCKEGQERRRLR